MAKTLIPGLDGIEGSRSLSFYAFKVSQPIGDFYIATIPARKLIEICFFDIRGLSQQDDFADFMGIQRELDLARVAGIRRYVHTVDPSFPTAVVLAVDERCASFESVDLPGNRNLVKMTLRNYPDSEDGLDPILYRDIARVIDGQHRIAGLIGFEGDHFDMNISVFVGADIATQASIFSTVNLAQTKVNKSLVYDLFSYEKTRSAEKTCHEVAVLLDREPDSPFYKKIKRLGVATEGRFGETLAQATFVKGLIQYISKDVLADREAAKRGRSFPTPKPKDLEKLVLRDFFTSGEDEVIADIIWTYFEAVKQKWPRAWRNTQKGWVLNKTAGYTGLMRFFHPCYLSLVPPGGVPTMRQFRSIFEPMDLDDDAFKSEHIRPGSSGEKYVYDLLVSKAAL